MGSTSDVCLFVDSPRLRWAIQGKCLIRFLLSPLSSGPLLSWLNLELLPGSTGTNEVGSTLTLVAKHLDRQKTNNGEGTPPECFHQSRTRVRGTKMTRYHRSPYRKRCRLGIGSLFTLFDPLGITPNNEKSKPVGSGGSTLARLKLKGIDGMTPQGVEYAA